MCSQWQPHLKSLSSIPTGVGLVNNINMEEMPNNTALEANYVHQIGTVHCHSASNQTDIGRWIDSSGVEITFPENPIFTTQHHSATFHSYISLSSNTGTIAILYIIKYYYNDSPNKHSPELEALMLTPRLTPRHNILSL